MKQPNREGRILKRIVATEGDRILPRDSYMEMIPEGNMIEPILIPKGHIWVEGDLGTRSLDSNVFGPVHVDNIVGVASRVVLPQKISKGRPMFMKLESYIPEEAKLRHFKKKE